MKGQLEDFLNSHIDNSQQNYISQKDALAPDLVGMKIFDGFLIGYASSQDPLFNRLQEEGVVGSHHKLPVDWLPGAQTVISIFLPFSARVKEANASTGPWPAKEWLHGRIEGQAFVSQLIGDLANFISKGGDRSLVPSQDSRFVADQGTYTSNWSERHVAFVAGLGTFCLSKGMITKKGVAGRFASLVTEASLDPSGRDYASYDEYCSMCGACIRACPAQAISMEGGKDHGPCFKFLLATKDKYQTHYGCGKCQVGLPCQDSNPVKGSLAV